MSNRALVLNASFEPLGVVPLRRAVILVLKGRADIIEEAAEAYFRSAYEALPAPLVVRLKTMVRVPYRASVPLTRRAVIARDGFECGYCGTHGNMATLTIDHVTPRSRGGQHRWENVVAACSKCNWKKDDRTPEEAGLTLRHRLYAPTGAMALAVVIGRIEPAWEGWLGLAAA